MTTTVILGTRQSTLILPPWSAGSLGDEYMLAAAAAFLATRGERVTIAEFPSYPGSTDRYENVLPGLKPLGVQFVDIEHHDQAFRESFDRAVLIGADTLDGVHSVEHSRRVLDGVSAIARTDRPIDIVSVSYSANSHPDIDALARTVPARAWYARDPRSVVRLRELGVGNVNWSGDLSLLTAEAIGHMASSCGLPSPSFPYVLVSLGPQSLRDVTTDEIAEVLSTAAKEAGAGLVIVPHDFRDFGGPTSCSTLEQLVAALALRGHNTNIKFIKQRITLVETASLARNAVATISGYMHLALFSSFNLTPSFFLAYHDKGKGQAAVNPLFTAGGLQDLKTFARQIGRKPYAQIALQRLRLVSQRRRARRQLSK